MTAPIVLFALFGLAAGISSWATKVWLLHSIKTKYPDHYRNIGSPSVLFQNASPFISISELKDKATIKDYKNYAMARAFLYVIDVLFLAAIIAFVFKLVR